MLGREPITDRRPALEPTPQDVADLKIFGVGVDESLRQDPAWIYVYEADKYCLLCVHYGGDGRTSIRSAPCPQPVADGPGGSRGGPRCSGGRRQDILPIM
jgi:hypothetical protein